jgi:hypothetical protein
VVILPRTHNDTLIKRHEKKSKYTRPVLSKTLNVSMLKRSLRNDHNLTQSKQKTTKYGESPGWNSATEKNGKK